MAHGAESPNWTIFSRPHSRIANNVSLLGKTVFSITMLYVLTTGNQLKVITLLFGFILSYILIEKMWTKVDSKPSNLEMLGSLELH